MKKIQLSQGLFAMVDDEDYNRLIERRWIAANHGHTFYAQSGQVVNSNLKRKKYTTVLMHRIILNTPKELEVDHIDHNGLNNQKSNLRTCTPSQNMRNRIPRGNSKYLGVFHRDVKYKDKIYHYIVASIKINDERVYLGKFNTELEAAQVYDSMAKKHFGEFANLNFK